MHAYVHIYTFYDYFEYEPATRMPWNCAVAHDSNQAQCDSLVVIIWSIIIHAYISTIPRQVNKFLRIWSLIPLEHSSFSCKLKGFDKINRKHFCCRYLSKRGHERFHKESLRISKDLGTNFKNQKYVNFSMKKCDKELRQVFSFELAETKHCGKVFVEYKTMTSKNYWLGAESSKHFT